MNESTQARIHDNYVISELSETVQNMNRHDEARAASIPIPLPLEIPPPPNLSQLPAHILHSGTVETLLGQNEDLMARLKVNIRRNSILEQQIMEQDRQTAELKGAHASLLAQFQVLQEKDEMLREKSQTFDIRTEELKNQLELMQIRVEAAEERSAELRAGIQFERTYRRRIRAWVRPFIDGLKSQLADAHTKIAFLDRQLGTREAVIGDLRERMESTISHMQTLQVTHNRNQTQLVEGYEARLTKAESDAAKAMAESSLLREKASRLDEAVSARAIAENRIVALERAKEEIEAQVKTFRQEAKAVAAESTTAHESAARLRKEADDAKLELTRVQDQLESMQAVWAEAQKKLEASQLQQDSLNKLNQELSRQLRSERKARETATQTIVQAIAPAVSTEKPSERMGKIDAILAEIESGFTKRGLEFIEDEAAIEIEAPRRNDGEAPTASV